MSKWLFEFLDYDSTVLCTLEPIVLPAGRDRIKLWRYVPDEPWITRLDRLVVKEMSGSPLVCAIGHLGPQRHPLSEGATFRAECTLDVG